MNKLYAQNLSADIARTIINKNGGNNIQIEQAGKSAYIAATAAYPATLAATKAVSINPIEAEVATFTATVTASSISGVNTVTIPSTIVSNNSVYFTSTQYPDKSSSILNFKYYWSKYPELFPTFPIVTFAFDTDNNLITEPSKLLNNLIKLLDEYYAKGFRIFVGFNSTELTASLPWFENHPDVSGISLYSSADSLAILKNIYRLQAPDSVLLNSLSLKLDLSKTIYYIYNSDTVFGLSFLNILTKQYGYKLKTFSILPDNSNLTADNIKKFYEGSTQTDISLLYNNTTSIINYLQIFDTSYPMIMPNYGINIGTDNIPINKLISLGNASSIAGKYHYLDFISIDTSPLFREGLDVLPYFSSAIPNCLLLINYLNRDLDVLSIPSYNGVIQFDENKDLKYYTISNFIFIKDGITYKYESEDLFSFSPIYGNIRSVILPSSVK
jgi:hypothetical protein